MSAPTLQPARLRGPYLMDWYADLLIDTLGAAQALKVTPHGPTRAAVQRAIDRRAAAQGGGA